MITPMASFNQWTKAEELVWHLAQAKGTKGFILAYNQPHVINPSNVGKSRKKDICPVVGPPTASTSGHLWMKRGGSRCVRP